MLKLELPKITSKRIILRIISFTNLSECNFNSSGDDLGAGGNLTVAPDAGQRLGGLE